MVNDGANPNKLITIEVMAGVTMIKYLGAVLSAIIPIRGLNNHGKRIIKSQIEANARVIPNFSINKGLNGAKKEEYISCNICDAATRITFPD